MACGVKKDSKMGKTEIEGHWIANLVIDKGNSPSPDLGITIDINLTEKRFGGKGVCNTYFGEINSFDAKKKTINLSKVSSTLVSCDKINYEMTYFEILETITHFEFKDGQYLLYGDEDPTAPLVILSRK